MTAVKLIRDPKKLARLYTLSSIFIGPFIIGFGNLVLTRGGGDYCDGAYSLPDGGMDPSRVTEFHNSQVFQVTCASIMLTLGLAILINLVVSARQKHSKINILSVLGVLFMMLGYVLVILMTNTPKGC